ncbi:hypothetical protein [Cryobacterium tagatosivorans]|uniref:LPXTG cell wall anchor domain-containing protein n=1 Tax=Cryobacterium tagatosivorans TaxID=1259199 RepID=A0A4R8UEY8_9MICO|nr:hypothetical protein [Cryobacterium tagatosivorans]TFB52342.1 hypothetical protein E3O23_06765 [Cryobacterium tagatosivorans]
MRGALVAAVAAAFLLIVGPPAAYAVDGPPRQPAVVEADATSVGRPVAPQPEAAPPAPAKPVPAEPAPATATPAGAGAFVWLLPLAGGLAVLGAGWVLSRRNRHDDLD